MTASLGWITLLEQLTEFRTLVYLLDYWPITNDLKDVNE